ncbi:MAG: hypothetical protein OXS28_18780 [Gammaproteobacteria bacterium]|nr:hypothetical protein [Gammaproteobacteria bacterium]
MATDQGQPEGAKGVALHLSTSQATPFGEGMLQPLRGRRPACGCRKDQVGINPIECVVLPDHQTMA